MADFTDEDKKERTTDYFEEGVHEVEIAVVSFGKTSDDKEFAEFTVAGSGDDARTGTARVWFTTPAAKNYSFGIIRSIFVHNTPEEKRDATRERINKIKNTAELEEACEALMGKKCWYSVAKSERTYTNEAGETKNSYDKNVYGYKPAPKTITPVETAQDGDINLTNVPF